MSRTTSIVTVKTESSRRTYACRSSPAADRKAHQLSNAIRRLYAAGASV